MFDVKTPDDAIAVGCLCVLGLLLLLIALSGGCDFIVEFPNPWVADDWK